MDATACLTYQPACWYKQLKWWMIQPSVGVELITNRDRLHMQLHAMQSLVILGVIFYLSCFKKHTPNSIYFVASWISYLDLDEWCSCVVEQALASSHRINSLYFVTVCCHHQINYNYLLLLFFSLDLFYAGWFDVHRILIFSTWLKSDLMSQTETSRMTLKPCICE